MEGDPAETRQSVDIPLPICLVTISHAVEEKICACCRGEFPLPCQIRCQLWGERPCGGSLSGRGAACPFQAFTVLVERPLRYRTEPSISDILNRMKKRPSSAYGGDPEACGILPRRWSGRDGGGSGRRIALDVGFLKRGGHIHIPRSFPWKKCHVRTLSGRPPRQCAGDGPAQFLFQYAVGLPPIVPGPPGQAQRAYPQTLKESTCAFGQ